MAQYFTDFSEYADGNFRTVMADWSEPWGTDPSKNADVVTSGAVTGGKFLQAEEGDNSTGRHTLVWDHPGTPSDVEVVTLSRINDAFTSGNENTIRHYTFGRVSGDENGYYAARRGSSRILEVGKYVDGSFTSLASSGIGDAPSEWWWTRLRIEGTSLKARTWEDGTVEPSSWDIELSDGSLASGGAGSALMWYAVFDFDAVGVGTNGDTAPSEAPASGEDRTSTEAHTAPIVTGTPSRTGTGSRTSPDAHAAPIVTGQAVRTGTASRVATTASATATSGEASRTGTAARVATTAHADPASTGPVSRDGTASRTTTAAHATAATGQPSRVGIGTRISASAHTGPIVAGPAQATTDVPQTRTATAARTGPIRSGPASRVATGARHTTAAHAQPAHVTASRVGVGHRTGTTAHVARIVAGPASAFHGAPADLPVRIQGRHPGPLTATGAHPDAVTASGRHTDRLTATGTLPGGPT